MGFNRVVEVLAVVYKRESGFRMDLVLIREEWRGKCEG